MKKQKATKSVRVTPRTYSLIKLFAAKHLTTIDGAVQILLHESR